MRSSKYATVLSSSLSESESSQPTVSSHSTTATTVSSEAMTQLTPMSVSTTTESRDQQRQPIPDTITPSTSSSAAPTHQTENPPQVDLSIFHCRFEGCSEFFHEDCPSCTLSFCETHLTAHTCQTNKRMTHTPESYDTESVIVLEGNETSKRQRLSSRGSNEYSRLLKALFDIQGRRPLSVECDFRPSVQQRGTTEHHKVCYNILCLSKYYWNNMHCCSFSSFYWTISI